MLITYNAQNNAQNNDQKQRSKHRSKHFVQNLRNMEHVNSYYTVAGADITFKTGDIEPSNSEGRVGTSGINKSLTHEQVIRIAYNTVCDPTCENPNIIIKAGPNAKWYLKYWEPATLQNQIAKWRASPIGQGKLKARVPPSLIFIGWKRIPERHATV